jgi:hypothetical protein
MRNKNADTVKYLKQEFNLSKCRKCHRHKPRRRHRILINQDITSRHNINEKRTMNTEENEYRRKYFNYY